MACRCAERRQMIREAVNQLKKKEPSTALQRALDVGRSLREDLAAAFRSAVIDAGGSLDGALNSRDDP